MAATPSDISPGQQGIPTVEAAGSADEAGNSAAAAAATASGATVAAATSQSLSCDPDDLEFELATELIYHRSREDYFSRAHRICMFLTIVLGAASVSAIAPAITGVATALVGALDLTLDLNTRANEHRDLRRGYFKLVQRLAAGRNDTAVCADIRRRMLKLSAMEPPAFVAVQLIARNQAILSLGRDRAALERLPRWKRALAHLWRFEES